MTLPIVDGTGKGYMAQVDSNNRLRTQTISDTVYDYQSNEGMAFNVNTEFMSITSSAETSIFYLQNNTGKDVVLASFFVGTGNAGGTPTEQGLIRAYFDPTGVSGGTSVSVVNRRAASATSLQFTGLKHDNSTPISATFASIAPILYQTQGPSSRVFGTVYLTLPNGKSILVTYQPNGAQTINIYTGFGGYLVD